MCDNLGDHLVGNVYIKVYISLYVAMVKTGFSTPHQHGIAYYWCVCQLGLWFINDGECIHNV